MSDQSIDRCHVHALACERCLELNELRDTVIRAEQRGGLVLVPINVQMWERSIQAAQHVTFESFAWSAPVGSEQDYTELLRQGRLTSKPFEGFGGRCRGWLHAGSGVTGVADEPS